MSQSARVMAVLADHRPHTIREIHERAGTMRLNSRVSELRKRGHRIECWRDGDDYLYRLDPATSEAVDAVAAVSPASGGEGRAETGSGTAIVAQHSGPGIRDAESGALASPEGLTATKPSSPGPAQLALIPAVTPRELWA